MKISDSVTLSDARVDDAGYLVANARTARVGIQQYLGIEMGRPDLNVVNVYRDESEVFKKLSLDTFSKIPVTLEHPAEPVTAANWKDHAVGTTGDEVLRDGEYLKIGLKITDAEAVKAIQNGKRELSVGYSTDIIWEDGFTADGTPYQARQTNIAANHIAIVDRGRAGSKVRIGDDAGKWGASPVTLPTADTKGSPMADNLRKVLVDGLQVETTDAGAQAIQKLLKDLESSAAKLVDTEKAHAARLADIERDHSAAIAAKDAELAQRDEQIGTLKADKKKLEDAAPKPADIDKMVADRAALVNAAKAIDKDIKTDGLTDAEIRKAAVTKSLGDEMVKDASDAEIAGMFKALTKDTDPVRKALQSQDRAPLTNDNGQAAYEKRLADAWKHKEA